MGLGGSICGAPGRCRRLLLASHERRCRRGNSSLVLHHRGNEIANSSAPPWCVTPPERRPSPRRRSGERDSTRCCGCLERLPGLAGDVSVGRDRLPGENQQGRPTAGPSWRRKSGTRGLLSHPARRSQSSSRCPSRASGWVPSQPTSWCRRDAAAPGTGLTYKRLTGCWCTHRVLCFAAVPNARPAWATCILAASRMPSWPTGSKPKMRPKAQMRLSARPWCGRATSSQVRG